MIISDVNDVDESWAQMFNALKPSTIEGRRKNGPKVEYLVRNPDEGYASWVAYKELARPLKGLARKYKKKFCVEEKPPAAVEKPEKALTNFWKRWKGREQTMEIAQMERDSFWPDYGE